MQAISPQAYVILGLLMEGDQHGYDLHRSEIFRIWSLPMSQLYNLLKRLEKEGLIRSSITHQTTRPGKRIFSLTDRGKSAFLGWVQHPSEKIRNIRTEFLAKLYMNDRLGLGLERDLIESQIRICLQKREHIQALLNQESGRFNRLVLSYRITMIEAAIHWLEDSKHLLKGKEDETI